MHSKSNDITETELLNIANIGDVQVDNSQSYSEPTDILDSTQLNNDGFVECSDSSTEEMTEISDICQNDFIRIYNSLDPISKIYYTPLSFARNVLVRPFHDKTLHFIWNVLLYDNPTGNDIFYCIRGDTTVIFHLREYSQPHDPSKPSIKFFVDFQSNVNVQNFHGAYGRDLNRLINQTFHNISDESNRKFKCHYEVKPDKFIIGWTNWVDH